MAAKAKKKSLPAAKPSHRGKRTGQSRAGAERTMSQLGAQTRIPASPDEAILETAPNPQIGVLYLARFTAPEFTSLCPVTGQPDFAHLVIDYAPDKHIIESKSFKLFLTSFRNHGAFHEDCTIEIAKRLLAAANQNGCASRDTGFRAVEFRSIFSIRPGRRQRGFGFRTPAFSLIADGGKLNYESLVYYSVVDGHDCFLCVGARN